LLDLNLIQKAMTAQNACCIRGEQKHEKTYYVLIFNTSINRIVFGVYDEKDFPQILELDYS
jgi:hypothetical protein